MSSSSTASIWDSSIDGDLPASLKNSNSEQQLRQQTKNHLIVEVIIMILLIIRFLGLEENLNNNL